MRVVWMCSRMCLVCGFFSRSFVGHSVESECALVVWEKKRRRPIISQFTNNSEGRALYEHYTFGNYLIFKSGCRHDRSNHLARLS